MRIKPRFPFWERAVRFRPLFHEMVMQYHQLSRHERQERENASSDTVMLSK
jgi:hypothetical protein